MWWLPATSLLTVGVLLYVTSALHVLSFSPFVVSRHEVDRDFAVREVLAQRTTPASVSDDRVVSTIRLRAGEHPDAARFDVPVPPGARMLNPRTGDSNQGAIPSRDRALLATSGEMSDVVAFYRDELVPRGWHEVRGWM